MFRFVCLIVLVVLACPHVSVAAPPNIVVVFIDDMGWGDLSCFGNRDAATPHIDRMASEGIAFEQFYVNSPICSPSRVAISTGQYPQRWRITSYLNNRKDNAKRGMADWLDPAAPMLARYLQNAGYATGHFGKWHMGGQRDVDDAPPISVYGFDQSLTNFEGMGAKLLPLTMKPGWEKPGRIWQDAERLGEPVTWMQRSRVTGGFVSRAIEFINQAQSANKPFYVNVWPDDVHGPFFPPVDKWGDDERALYLAVLVEMDRQLAPLFERIGDDGALRDNTLILICSDNGPKPGAGRAGDFRGYKAHLYEGGIRSPLMVWGPGLIDEDAIGTRNSTSVFAAIDLVPSLLAMADVSPSPAPQFDGENVLDTLMGESNASRIAPLFFSRPPDRKHFGGVRDLPDLAIRQGNWKLLCDYDGGRPELYHLLEDPGETNNLAQMHPDLVEEMSKLVRNWYEQMPTGP